MNDLIEAIRIKLNIADNIFINGEIESYLEDIAPVDYQDFFKELSGDQFAYKQGMDRVAIVSESFKERNIAKISKTVPCKAKDLHDRLFRLKEHLGDEYKDKDFSCIKFGDGRMFSDIEIIILGNLNLDLIMGKILSPYDTDLIVNMIKDAMVKYNQAKAEGLAVSLNDKKLLSNKS